MFGFDPDQWDAARSQACHALVQRALSGETIFYSELTPKITAIHLVTGGDKDRAALGKMLGQISRRTHAQGIGMLSAFVVLKETNRPANRFFALAKELGYRFDDRDKFWLQQMTELTNHYNSVGPERTGRECG